MTSRLRSLARSALLVLALSCLAAPASAEPAALDPELAQGFAGLKQTAGFVAQAPDDWQNAWRPNWLRSIHAVHPNKPEHEFLAQVLAAGACSE